MIRNPPSVRNPGAGYRALRPFGWFIFCGLLVSCLSWSSADQVDMLNGDRYAGRVTSIATNTVTLQSDVLGTITLPRDKVAHIALGNGAAINSAPVKPSVDRLQTTASASTNSSSELSAAIQQLRHNSSAVKQVQDE